MRNVFSPFDVVGLGLEVLDVRDLVRFWLNPFLPSEGDGLGLDPVVMFDLV